MPLAIAAALAMESLPGASLWTTTGAEGKKAAIQQQLSEWAFLTKLTSHSKLPSKLPRSIKTLARRGIPSEVRAQAWYLLSGAAERKLTADSAVPYSKLCADYNSVSDETVYRSESDAKLSCLSLSTYHKLFRSARGIESISRMLLAYGALHPTLGYVKGLHHVAGVMLLVFGREREDDAFWTMVAFMEDRLLPNSQGRVSRASRVECRVLAQLLHAKLPAVATQLSKLAPPPAATTHTKAGGMTHGSGGGYGSSSSSSLGPLVEVLAQGWFANGFATTLPLEVVLRVWDVLACEGAKAAHRVAMALLKAAGPCMASAKDADGLKRIVDARVRQEVLRLMGTTPTNHSTGTVTTASMGAGANAGGMGGYAVPGMMSGGGVGAAVHAHVHAPVPARSHSHAQLDAGRMSSSTSNSSISSLASNMSCSSAPASSSGMGTAISGSGYSDHIAVTAPAASRTSPVLTRLGSALPAAAAAAGAPMVSAAPGNPAAGAGALMGHWGQQHTPAHMGHLGPVGQMTHPMGHGSSAGADALLLSAFKGTGSFKGAWLVQLRAAAEAQMPLML